MTYQKTWGNWVEGEVDGYRFQAKVFDEGSEYGINGGRISKLWMAKILEPWMTTGGAIIEYDRGWSTADGEEADEELILATVPEEARIAYKKIVAEFR